MTDQFPPGRDDRNDPETHVEPVDPEEPEDDLVNRVYGPSQADIERSWEEHDTGAVQERPSLGGAIWKYVVVGVSLVILISLAVGTIGPIFGRSRTVDTAQRTQPELIAVSVLRVIDARTIVVRSGAGEQTVRLIGIASPVFGDPWHEFARSVSESWIDGEEVLLESDERDVDGQGRALRYVYFDNVMINAALILNGLGKVETVQPNVRHNGLLAELERQARESGRGIWGDVDGASGSDSGPRNTEASLHPDQYGGIYARPPAS